jgi:hypothetical protein
MNMKRTATALIVSGMLAMPVLAQDQKHLFGPPPQISSLSLQQYASNGFALLVPSNATVTEHNARSTVILGPRVEFRDPVTGMRSSRWGYIFSIDLLDNPGQLSGEDYALSLIQRLYEQSRDGDGPGSGAPFDAQGNVKPDRVERLTLGGRAAFKVMFYGPDSDVYRIYVADGETMISFGYEDTGIAEDPLAKIEIDVYALMLATVRFEE